MHKAFSEGDLEPEERLFRALGRAEDRLSRLDERARGCGFAAGWRERADVRAALGALSAQGELAHAEDLILHALGADLHAPDRTLLRAHAALRARQRAWLGGEELLSWRGVAWLSGRTAAAPANAARPTLRVGEAAAAIGAVAEIAAFFGRLEQRQSDDARAGVEECLEVLDVAAGSPPLLAAAALIEAWRVVDPLPDAKALGGVLAAQALRTQRRFTTGLFPFEAALQRRPMPARLAWAPPLERLRFWCEVVERSADFELEELNRLATQKALIERRAAGGRRHGKAPALAALAVDRAVLTTELIVRELGVTPQGCGQLIKRFDGVLREITGRSAYRVWRL
jgi:hypothetical protein